MRRSPLIIIIKCNNSLPPFSLYITSCCCLDIVVNLQVGIDRLMGPEKQSHLLFCFNNQKKKIVRESIRPNKNPKE